MPIVKTRSVNSATVNGGVKNQALESFNGTPTNCPSLRTRFGIRLSFASPALDRRPRGPAALMPSIPTQIPAPAQRARLVPAPARTNITNRRPTANTISISINAINDNERVPRHPPLMAARATGAISRSF